MRAPRGVAVGVTALVCGASLAGALADAAGTASAPSPFPYSLELQPPAAPIVPGQRATYQLVIRSRLRAAGKRMVAFADASYGKVIAASVHARFKSVGGGDTVAYLDVPPLAPRSQRTIRLTVLPMSPAFALTVESLPGEVDETGTHASVDSAPNTAAQPPFPLSVELRGPSHFTPRRPCEFQVVVRNVGASTVDAATMAIAPINEATGKQIPFTTAWNDLVRTPDQVYAQLGSLAPGAVVSMSVRFVAPVLGHGLRAHTYGVTARTTPFGQPGGFATAQLAVTRG